MAPNGQAFTTSLGPKVMAGPYHSSYVRPGRAGSCRTWAEGCGAQDESYSTKTMILYEAPSRHCPSKSATWRRRVNAVLGEVVV